MNNTVPNIISKILDESKVDNPWVNSPYKVLLDLTIDGRGKVGEVICSEACKINPILTINEDISDVNAKGNNIHYDMKINNKYIEVKTAYRDGRNAWQHENLYKDSINCDYVLFVDFDYEGIHLSMFKTSDLPLSCDSEFFPGKHGTLRKNKDDGYKLDFSRRTFSNFENRHYQYLKAEDASLDNIGKFIGKELLYYDDIGVVS